MPSTEHEAAVAMIQEAPPVASLTIAELRQTQTETAEPPASDVVVESVDAAGVACERLRVPESTDGVALVWLHGGGYVIGSLASHRASVSEFARSVQAVGLNVGYRLAPENVFPAAVDDALGAYRWLLASGIDASRVVIGGDSAGAAIALATQMRLRDAGDPLPACSVLLSPWTDLEITGDSAQPGRTQDPLLTPELLKDWAKLYAGEDLRNAEASPLYGEFSDLPPMLILAGTRDILVDDARRTATQARIAGCEVELDEYPGVIHNWPMFDTTMPEAVEALTHVSQFARKHLT